MNKNSLNNSAQPYQQFHPPLSPPMNGYEDQYIQNPYYGSPTLPGSLGTPNFGNCFGFHSSLSDSHGSRHSTRRSTPGSFTSEPRVEDSDVGLVVTRPLLKALARECRPFPPWCVGFSVPDEAREELRLFASFLRATPWELACSESAVQLATKIMQGIWPDVIMKAMSTTAAGLSPHKDVILHYYAENSPVDPRDMESIQQGIQKNANSHGAQAVFTTDYREVPCILLTDPRSGKRLTIRYGTQVSQAEYASNVFRTTFASNNDYHATLTLLDALPRQNKILDDTGAMKDALNGEALATMLTAIINSYDNSETPDSYRLMMDFFLTYGFTANFDLAKQSVTINGMSKPTPKEHQNAQLSVLDPCDETRNLTPMLEKAARLQAVFNYCYTALLQFTQVSQRQQRAQSTLSAIIGGESYWGRVLQLYHEGISPYAEEVNVKKHVLPHYL